jgi:glycosyltransferase involved in cell wall biosynthesis
MSAVPLSVLHVHSGNLYGGIETVLVTIARRQREVPGTRHAFALCFPGRCAAALGAAGAPPAALGAVRARRPWAVLAARRRLAALLGAERPYVAVTHSPWAHALFGPAIRAAGIPLVSWLHGAADGRHWLERWARRTPPDLAICVSHFVAGSAERLFPGVRSEVLHPPVDPAHPAARRPDLRREVRAVLGTPADATVIVQVGRMEAGKGQEVLLEALGALRERGDWACWIVGGAQRPDEIAYGERLKRRAGALGLAERVRFLGQRDDVPALLSAADVFCQPNTGPEGFGIVFVEALAHGLPVVAAAIGAAPEIVNPSCGLTVPAGDAGALAEALGLLLDNPGRRAALGVAGPVRAAALCDPVRQLERLGDLLRTVVGSELHAPEGRTR